MVIKILFLWEVHFFSELCRGKATVAYKKPQEGKRGGRERLRGEGGQIKFIDLRFGRWQFVGLSELCWGRQQGPIQSPKKGRKEDTKG